MDEHKTPGQNWKELDTRQRINYFWDYYKIHTAVGLIILVFVLYTVWVVTHPAAEVVMRAFIFSDVLDDTMAREAQEALAEKIGVVPDAVFLDGGHEDNDVGGMQLATLLGIGEVDLVICQEEMFRKLAGEGIFFDLETVLTDEQMKIYEDYIISSAGYEEPYDINGGLNVELGYGAGEIRPYGVRISDSSVYAAMSMTGRELYCGIVSYSANPDKAILCFNYLMGGNNS